MVVITVNSQTGLPLEEQSYCPPMSLLGALFFCCTNASLDCILKFRLSRRNFKTKTKYALDICTLLCLQTQEPVPLCKNLALVTVLQISSFLSSLGWRISGSLLWCLILHCDVQSSCSNNPLGSYLLSHYQGERWTHSTTGVLQKTSPWRVFTFFAYCPVSAHLICPVNQVFCFSLLLLCQHLNSRREQGLLSDTLQ